MITYQYRLYNALLTTNRTLPNLDLLAGTGAEWPLSVTLAEHTPAPDAWTSGPWQDYALRVPSQAFTVWRAPAPVGWAFRLGYGNQGYAADFTIRSDCQAIWAGWQPRAIDAATTSELVYRLLAGPVVPYVLRLAGQIALHGAVVTTDKGGVAFVGPSGAGKSTLAATCAQRGWATLADDVVVMTTKDGHYDAHPGPPNRHLWPSTLAALPEEGLHHPVVHPGTTKRHVDCTGPAAPAWSAFVRTAQPLYAIFLLEPFVDAGAVTSIERVQAARALPLLLRNRYGLVDTPPEARSSEFRQLAALVEQAAVYRTIRPDRPDTHVELVELIQRVLGA